ncbi:glycosyl hydrolase [Gorillibacterium sp. sgz5001074]|uniref:glycosyl hydrolase n=1 Tax=Gorillibacterium sp. sgz5001074 TaxID=3446695 RepID=UPI003F67A756
MDLQQFRNPDAQYRIQPFWFWNSDMREEEIVRQIEEMHDKGVGGFFICPRQGLQVPYLSEAWFKLVQVAVHAAKARGMHVWLYDEYPYPSGIAGGEVTLLHPDAKHQTLEAAELQAAGGDRVELELPWAKVIYAKAVPVTASGERLWESAVDLRSSIGNIQADPVFQKTGLTTYNQKRFFTYRTVYRLDWEAPGDYPEWEVKVYQEKEIEDFKYYGTFVDPCHKEAMATFIKLTHERYAQSIGEEFGRTVKGMFTDEIGLLGRMPWTPRLPAYFLERNGYSITEHLPALSNASYPDAAGIRYDYYQALHELLTDSYHKQVYDWCEAHGLQYVAEVPSIRMTTQRFSHVPGGDSCHEKLGRSLEWILRRYTASFRDNPKMMSSIARQLGRERNLDECFHSVGWSMNLQDAKWMIDRMAAFGTNMYTFHAFFYTLDGLTQHDAPPSQFYQNPYWAHFRQLGDYAGRISYMMTQGVADIRIAMLDPTTSYWTQMSNPLHHFDYGGTDPVEKERLERMKEEWRSLSVYLLQARRDYDHLDAELLAEAAVKDGKLVIGKAVYSVLLIPPVTNLETKAWDTIKRFLEAGGTVIATGSLPRERLGPDHTVPEEAEVWLGGGQAEAEQTVTVRGIGNAYRILRGTDAPEESVHRMLGTLLDQLMPSAAALHCGEDCRSFLLQGRYGDDGGYTVFASNQEGEARNARLTVYPKLVWPESVSEESEVLLAELLDLETGAVTPLQTEQNEEGVSVRLPFAPYASRMIRFIRKPAESEQPACAGAAPWTWEVEAEGPWSLQAQEPNSLRFESFELSIGGIGSRTSGRVQAKTFIDQCADLAEQALFPVAFGQIFGTPKKLRLQYPLDCRYRAEFTVEKLPEAALLLMDRSAILGEWELLVNGKSFKQADFAARPLYDQANLVCEVTAALREGRNELAVLVTVGQDWEGVVDAIHLLGGFGVRPETETSAPALIPSPEAAPSLAAECYYPGYPYHAGTLIFSRPVEIATVPEAPEFELRFTGWDPHDTVEVLVNGRPLGVRPWSPYVWTGDSAILKAGANEVTVRVTGTLIGLLEGKYFDYQAHRVVPV